MWALETSLIWAKDFLISLSKVSSQFICMISDFSSFAMQKKTGTEDFIKGPLKIWLNSRDSLVVLFQWMWMKNDWILTSWQEEDDLEEPWQQLAEEKKIKQPESSSAASNTCLSKTVKVSLGYSGALEIGLLCLIDSSGLESACKFIIQQWWSSEVKGDEQEVKSFNVGCRGLTGVCAE